MSHFWVTKVSRSLSRFDLSGDESSSEGEMQRILFYGGEKGLEKIEIESVAYNCFVAGAPVQRSCCIAHSFQPRMVTCCRRRISVPFR
jgi:hypothetical protein